MEKVSAAPSTGSREEQGSTRRIVYASIIAFLAWTFSIFNFFIFGYLVPVIAPVFNWSFTDVGIIFTAISLGTILTSLTVGPMTDYLGRRKALALAVLGGALSSGLIPLAAYLNGTFAKVYIIAIRSLSGYAISAQAINATYLNEMYGPKRRGLLYSFVQGGFTVGALLAAASALFLLPLIGWNQLFLIGSLPVFLIILAVGRLPESSRFLHLKGIREAQRRGDEKRVQELRRIYEVDAEKAKKFTYRQLFGPDLRRHTLSLTTAFTLQWFVTAIFQILATTVLSVGKEISLASSFEWLIATNLLSYPSYLLFGYLGDFVPRRDLVIFCWLTSGVGYVSMLFLQGFWPVVLAYTVGYFFQAGAFAPMFSYMAESFPTRTRGTGAIFVSSISQVGAVTAFGMFSAFTASGFSIATAALFAGGIPALLSSLSLLGARRIPPRTELERISV